jgi:hypothetical protein
MDLRARRGSKQCCVFRQPGHESNNRVRRSFQRLRSKFQHVSATHALPCKHNLYLLIGVFAKGHSIDIYEPIETRRVCVIGSDLSAVRG